MTGGICLDSFHMFGQARRNCRYCRYWCVGVVFAMVSYESHGLGSATLDSFTCPRPTQALLMVMTRNHMDLLLTASGSNSTSWPLLPCAGSPRKLRQLPGTQSLCSTNSLVNEFRRRWFGCQPSDTAVHEQHSHSVCGFLLPFIFLHTIDPQTN